jgi:hypothetical protein
MSKHEIEALNATELIAAAFEWFVVHGHEDADLVERVVDAYLAAAESVPS